MTERKQGQQLDLWLQPFASVTSRGVQKYSEKDYKLYAKMEELCEQTSEKQFLK
jgi:hypothetical protein